MMHTTKLIYNINRGINNSDFYNIFYNHKKTQEHSPRVEDN